jgi:hypothetical protein
MTDYILFDRATGDLRSLTTCTSDQIMFQTMGGVLGYAEIEGAFRTTTLVDGMVTHSFNLDAIRTPLLRRIDAEAEACRGRFITAGSGQAITYFAKQQEAVAFIADASASVPILTAEAAAIGVTVAELAAEVSTAAVAWLTIGAKIEAARRGAKKAITDASDILAMTTAAAINWASVVA